MIKSIIEKRSNGEVVSTTGIKPGMIMTYQASTRTISWFMAADIKDHKRLSNLATLPSEKREALLVSNISVEDLAFKTDFRGADDEKPGDNKLCAYFLESENRLGEFVGLLQELSGLRAVRCEIMPPHYEQ